MKNDNNKSCLYGYIKRILQTKLNQAFYDSDNKILSNLKGLNEISEKNGNNLNDI